MDRLANFFRGSMTADEERQVAELEAGHKAIMERLFAHFEFTERYRDTLANDVRELEQLAAAARAAPDGPAPQASPTVRLGRTEMTEDDAVDHVAECIQFSQKFSSLK